MAHDLVVQELRAQGVGTGHVGFHRGRVGGNS